MRLLVGSGAGAASDILIRLFARRLTARFGLSVTVEDEPRAAGKLAASRLAHAAADGGLIAFLPSGLVYSALLRESGVNWDYAAFGWIGSFSSDRRVLVVNRKSGVTSFDQLLHRTTPLVVPCGSASNPSFYESRIVSHLTGAPIKPVPGYPGGGRTLAFVSGEADAMLATFDGLKAAMETPGARVILRLNDLPLPQLQGAGPDQPPTLARYAKGLDAAPLLELIDAHAALGRMIALPPNTPPGVLARWRERFDALVSEDSFQAEARAAGYVIEPTPGVAVQHRIASILSGSARPALARALAAR